MRLCRLGNWSLDFNPLEPRFFDPRLGRYGVRYRDHPPGHNEMQPFHHLAFDRDDALLGVHRVFEGFDDLLRPSDFFVLLKVVLPSC